jgi:two-component system sensor histidine kinase KdpD
LKLLNTRELSSIKQFIISIAIILSIALIAFFFKELIGYKVVALILLMALSFIAMLFEIKPVLFSALLSSLIWNFFFIPPIFTFHITSTEDGLMFLLYFIIAFVNTVLSFKIRKEEKKAREKEKEVEQIQLYNTLLNSLSHELRTPISTIIGSVDTLQDTSIQLNEQQRKELLCQIDTAGTRLNRQVENLLNMSRLESGILSPSFEWCETNELISKVIHDFPAAHQEKIKFVPNETIPLMKIDIGLMEQIIHNLLHNSIQYAGENNKITIDSIFEKNAWKLTISDTGKGIDQQYINKIFDKFYRVPNSKTGGSGLGLSIVKGFVEMQNGKVYAKNNSSKGVSFSIELPVDVSFISNLKNE